MKNRAFIGCLLFVLAFLPAKSQEVLSAPADTLVFKGQLISWINLNPKNDLPVWLGARYLPQVNYEIRFPQNRLIDFEASANLFGAMGLSSKEPLYLDGSLKPYRLWARYSARQLEVRAGLQKINFGSASLLRPLMWFDQIDPRDPIQFTDGVWGVLGRYYFLNNANIWFWSLYGNTNPRGWDLVKTARRQPEFGGRVQLPLPKGEVGITVHHRQADTRNLNGIPEFANAPETRFGIDAKFDLIVGCWLEASWTANAEDLGPFTNQEMFNAGVDYTFGIGNGLYVVYEQLLVALDERAFSFSNATTLSLLSFSYPIGLFDNLSAIVYIDWTNGHVYNFVNWTMQFDKTTLYLMGYWNPKNTQLPSQNNATQNLYSGLGIQVMFLFNH